MCLTDNSINKYLRPLLTLYSPLKQEVSKATGLGCLAHQKYVLSRHQARNTAHRCPGNLSGKSRKVFQRRAPISLADIFKFRELGPSQLPPSLAMHLRLVSTCFLSFKYDTKADGT